MCLFPLQHTLSRPWEIQKPFSWKSANSTKENNGSNRRKKSSIYHAYSLQNRECWRHSLRNQRRLSTSERILALLETHSFFVTSLQRRSQGCQNCSRERGILYLVANCRYKRHLESDIWLHTRTSDPSWLNLSPHHHPCPLFWLWQSKWDKAKASYCWQGLRPAISMFSGTIVRPNLKTSNIAERNAGLRVYMQSSDEFKEKSRKGSGVHRLNSLSCAFPNRGHLQVFPNLRRRCRTRQKWPSALANVQDTAWPKVHSSLARVCSKLFLKLGL